MSTPFRLAIVTSHPVQYQIPWYQAMAAHPELSLEVLYCHHATPQEQAAAGFGVKFEWDRPLLEGYAHRFLKNVSPVPSVNTFDGLDNPEIATLLNPSRYDAVLVSGWHYKSAVRALWAGWRNELKVFARGDSHLRGAPRSLPKRAVKQLLYRSFIPRLDACLPVGQWSKEYFLAYGAKPERVFRVPHTIDEGFFAAQWQQGMVRRRDLRAQWQLDEAQTLWLYSGKFLPIKQPLHYLQAIEQAHASGAPVAGLMVGDGPLRNDCEEFVRARRLPVTFTGFLNQSEIVSAYAAADALVLTSQSETWGLVVNEAMFCRRAVIVSDTVGAGPDLVFAGETGEIVRSTDVRQLADVIAKYSRAPKQLAAMGEAAFVRVGYCSPEAAVNGVLDALRATIAERQPAAVRRATGVA